MKPKYIRVLQALESAMEFTFPASNRFLGGYTLVMGVNEHRNPVICYKLPLGWPQVTGYRIMNADISLNEFIEACEELDDVDVPIVIPSYDKNQH